MGLGQVRANLARRLQARHAGHADVEHAQVRARRERLLERLDAVARLRHDLDVRLALEQQPDARPDDAVVVGDERAHAVSRSVEDAI